MATSKIKRVSSFSTSKILNYPLLSHLSQHPQSQGLSSQNDKKRVMYFVIPPNDTEEKCLERDLGDVYQTAEAHFLTVNWIKDEDCKNVVLEDDGNIFVFESFESPGYEYWNNKNKAPISTDNPYRVEILGPHVLNYIFHSPNVLSFSTRLFPTFTLSMRGMIISLSGFKDGTKERLEKLVRWMNGTVTPSLIKATTHVVTGSALTAKSIQAHKQQIPVMTAAWIEEVWTDNQTKAVDASDPKYVKHTCPIFYNVSICMSQIAASLKNTLKVAVQRHGGECKPDLVRGTTNILVTTSAESEKFKWAKRWKLPCVSPEWVESSTEQGYLLPPGNFQISEVRPFLTSTPAHSLAQNYDLDNTGCSAINEPSRFLIDETKETDTTDIQVSDEKIRLHNVITQLKAITDQGYLDGCRIFVVNYDKHSDLKGVFNSCGALRHNQLQEGVTHVVCIERTLPKAVQLKLKELNSMPAVVTGEWILQSAQEGSPAEEENFKLESLPLEAHVEVQESVYSVEPSNTTCARGRISASAVETNIGEREQSVSINVISNIRDHDEETIDQVGGANASNATLGGGIRSRNSCNTSRDTDSETSTTCNRDAVNVEPADESTPALLVGTSFYNGLKDDKKVYNYIKDIIIKNGGRLKESNADVAILPSVTSHKEYEKGDKQFTKDWLFDCLDRNTLDLNLQYFYTPRLAFQQMNQILKGAICAISQYPSNERAYLMELIIAMGGKYQEVFARKDNDSNGTLRSTHLICKNMETEKAKAGKRWKANVVVAEWVVDCFSEKKRVKEALYDPAVISTTSEDRTVFLPTPQRRHDTSKQNTSMKTEFPPSTSKEVPSAKFQKPSAKAAPVAGPSKLAIKQDDAPTTSAAPTPSTPKNDSKGQEECNISPKSASRSSEERRLLKQLAEYKANFPYSDESFARLKESVAANGFEFDKISPFTSFEEKRMRLDPSLRFGFDTTLEEKMFRDKIEMCLNRSPGSPILKMKQSTPLSELARRLQNAHSSYEESPESQGSSSSPPHTSTPKTRQSDGMGQKLRKKAAINRFSIGSDAGEDDDIQDNMEGEAIIEDGVVLEGIRVLNNGRTEASKRPSDGSPEREGIKGNKRTKLRKTSETENNQNVNSATGQDKSGSPNENTVPKDQEDESTEIPCTSKKTNRLQVLANLLEDNPILQSGMSPIKRRSNGPPIIPVGDDDDDDQDEIERPHLSWRDDDDEEKNKLPTVKRNGKIPRINQPAKDSAAAEEPPSETKPSEGRKRSSRLKRSNSGVNELSERTTRRTRSQSKTRKEEAPHGHLPVPAKPDVGKKSKKKSQPIFPFELPPNPVFVVSSLSQEEKNMALNIIPRLGGSVSKLSCFDPNCTALISSTLLRSEKVLGCIAAGKYILKYDYLVKCSINQQFLPITEEDVWHGDNINNEKERDLATAAFNWFIAQKNDSSLKPMSGKKFWFSNISKEKLAAYVRLIDASGGEVVSSLDDATTIITEKAIDVSTRAGVEVQNAMYLNTLILSNPPVVL